MRKATAALATAACCCEPAIAEAAAQAAHTPVPSGFLLGLAIAYLTRKRQIGGWLLYYYLQLFLSTAFLFVVTVPQAASLSNPAGWDDSKLYGLYLLSIVPFIVVFVTEGLLAAVLLFRRTERILRLLRFSQVLAVLAGLLSLLIDLSYFDEDMAIFFDIYSLLFASIWTWYFRSSPRVRKVFIEHSWSGEVQQVARQPETQAEKQYLRWRGAKSAGIALVLALVLLAANNSLSAAGAHPTPLYASVVYALIAGALGRYLPMRKKKRDALS